MSDEVFNERQRQLLHQFSELRAALVHEEFECPAGADLIIPIVRGRPYTDVTIESLVIRTGLGRDHLLDRLKCLEDRGIVECEDIVGE